MIKGLLTAVLLCFIFSASRAQVDQKYFGRSGRSHTAIQTAVLTGGNRVTVGYAFTGTTSSQACDAFIMCTDPSDNVLWAKELGTPNADRFLNVVATQDGGCVAVGYANATGIFSGNYALIMKFDASGNQLWSHTYNATANGELFFYLVQDPATGHIICSGYNDFAGGTVNSLLMDFDNAGTLLWSKVYSQVSSDAATGIGILGSNIIVSGYFQGGSYYDGYLMSVSEANGTINWAESYDINSAIAPGNASVVPSDMQIANNRIYVGNGLANDYSSSNNSFALVSFDTTGQNPVCVEVKNSATNTVSPYYFQMVGSDAYIVTHPANNLWDCFVGYSPANMPDAAFIKMTDITSPNTSVVYAREIPFTGQQSIIKFRVTSGHIVGVGAAANDPTNLIGTEDVYKVEADTSFPITPTDCVSDMPNMQYGNPVVTINPTYSFNNGITTPVFTAQVTLTTTPVTITSVNTCGSIIPISTDTCNLVSLPDTLSACPGTAITLPGTISGGDSILSINWTPTTGLSNPQSLTPVLTAGSTGGYYNLTVQSLMPTNLVVNGDFSAGNTGFTSAYTYATGSSGIVPDGTYTITTNPINNHPTAASFNDHTTGTGNMMAVNGASSPVNAWCQTITVVPGTDYNFAAWFANWSANTTSNLPQLQFEINGVPLGSVFNINGTQGLWTEFNATWNSGTSTSATICIHDQQTAANGNDFSIDDITFQQICVAKDSVYVNPVSSGALTVTTNTPVCAGQTLSFTATNIAGAIYSWTGPNGFTATTYNPSIAGVTTAATGSYNVSATVGGCSANATVPVTVSPTPVANAGNDTLICPGTTLQLNGTGTGSYLWLPSAGLSNNQIANPTASLNATTTYSFIVTNAQGCADTDMITITVPSVTGFFTAPNVTLCKGDVLQLLATGGTSYYWTPSTGLSANNIPNPTVNITSDADYQVTISVPACNVSTTLPVHVTVRPHPPVTATASNDIDCGHNRTILKANGASTYVWTPAATLDNAQSPSPVATPEVTTTYIVIGTDIYGCTGQSEVKVNVINDGDGRIVEPNAFTPNGDGLNDCFRIELPGSNVSGFELHIFNRWGNEVWHTYSLNDCWDGTYNGVMQPLDVYMYYYKAKSSFCGAIHGKGNVTLVR